MRRFAACRLILCAVLFSAPTFADEGAARTVPPATASDLERMRLLVRQSALRQRTERGTTALTLGAGGAIHLGVGVTFMAREGVGDLSEPAQVFGVVQTAVGGLQLAGSVLPLLVVSEGERLEGELERDAAEHPDDTAGIVSRGEKRLVEAAASARSGRVVSLIVNAIVLGGEVGVFIVNELQDEPSRGLRFGIGSALVAVGTSTFGQVFPSELERLAEVWRSTPDRRAAGRHPQRIGVAPLAGGGGLATWAFTF